MAITLKNVRLAFPELWKATKVEPTNDTEVAKFRATLLLTKDDPQLKALHAEAKKVAVDKWGDKWKDEDFREVVEKVYCQNGDAKARWDGYEGHMFVPANNPKRPLVIDRDRSPLTEADGKVYAGCFVNARVDIWPQDNKWGKALRATLLGVQFYGEGDSFGGGRVASVDEFEDLEDEGQEEADLEISDDPLA